MNTLQDVEALLKGVRAAQGVTFAYLRERGLYPNTVRRMEEGASTRWLHSLNICTS